MTLIRRLALTIALLAIAGPIGLDACLSCCKTAAVKAATTDRASCHQHTATTGTRVQGQAPPCGHNHERADAVLSASEAYRDLGFGIRDSLGSTGFVGDVSTSASTICSVNSPFRITSPDTTQTPLRI